jgi:para-nitrobenzyl esterase
MADDRSGNPRVTISGGILEGTIEPDSGVRSFKGIPFAAPPVGDLRWRPPQSAAPWAGVRMAHQFGPRAMQLPVFGDMNFRSHGMSEDCLYLNVWAPAEPAGESVLRLTHSDNNGGVIVPQTTERSLTTPIMTLENAQYPS